MTGHPADESRRLRQVTNDVDELYALMARTDARVQQLGAVVDSHTTMLQEHSTKLDALKTEVREVRTDVREILGILKA